MLLQFTSYFRWGHSIHLHKFESLLHSRQAMHRDITMTGSDTVPDFLELTVSRWCASGRGGITRWLESHHPAFTGSHLSHQCCFSPQRVMLLPIPWIIVIIFFPNRHIPFSQQTPHFCAYPNTNFCSLIIPPKGLADNNLCCNSFDLNKQIFV